MRVTFSCYSFAQLKLTDTIKTYLNLFTTDFPKFELAYIFRDFYIKKRKKKKSFDLYDDALVRKSSFEPVGRINDNELQ